jgi:1-acyl-sn-glycerol-3-phosphate acyltransferase
MADARDPLGYRIVLRFFRGLVGLFFREVEVTGLDKVPRDRGGILVSWHPNGLIDPGLLLTQFDRRVIFGARHGLFAVPLLGSLLRSIGTVPIRRALDAGLSAEARKEQNRRALDALAKEVARGSFSALFPEGISHDEPHPVELKTGAARLYHAAVELTPKGKLPPVIVPVGLHYDKKRLFRSRALVWFHAPLELPDELAAAPAADETEEQAKDRARRLTDLIEHALREVVHATEDWTIHELLHRGRKMLRAERARRAGAAPARPTIGEKAIGFARIRAGYYARLATDGDRVREILTRAQRYDADLRALGLQDHELDRPPALPAQALFTMLFQLVLVFLVVPPVLLFGYLVNGPTALALLALCRIAARYEKDEATIKLLVGALAFPLTWLAAAVLAAWSHEAVQALLPQLPKGALLIGLFVALAAGLGGALSLRYLEIAAETLRAVRVRLTRARRQTTVERLLSERGALSDQLLSLAEGLDLPGVVDSEGRVHRTR